MAKLSAKNKRRLDFIAKRISNLERSIIVKRGHVITGKMKNSVDTILNVSKTSEFSIEVSSTDYFKYVDAIDMKKGMPSMLDELLNSAEFKKVLEEIENIIADWVEESIFTGLKGPK